MNVLISGAKSRRGLRRPTDPDVLRRPRLGWPNALRPRAYDYPSAWCGSASLCRKRIGSTPSTADVQQLVGLRLAAGERMHAHLNAGGSWLDQSPHRSTGDWVSFWCLWEQIDYPRPIYR